MSDGKRSPKGVARKRAERCRALLGKVSPKAMNRPQDHRAARAAIRHRALTLVRTGALAVASAFVLSLGCNTPKLPPPPPPAPEPVVPRPIWLDKETNWDTLVEIEEWLNTQGPQHNAGFQNEARLRLNEGRVLYSRMDLEKGTAPSKTVRARAEAARDGFQAILDDPAAGPASKARAKIGLQSAVALLDSPAASKPDLLIIDRSNWKARAPRTDRLTALKGSWSRITVHHSDESRSAQTGGTLEDSEEVVRLIQKFHMEDPEHRWGDIGYHFLIDAAGRIFEGRELGWQGAHAGGPGGTNNTQNIGICMLGDFAKRAPTPAALKSLELLVESLRTQYRIPAARVYAHKEFTTTQCPGPALSAWLKSHYR